jgi:hypoxanthine phosphoribosyltransferase
MKTTIIHDQKYICPSWDQLGHIVFEMSTRIVNSDLKFDRVVALAKGGLTFSRTVVDYLGMKELSSIQIEFYTGIGEVNKTPVITQSLPISIRNERILIFDEVVDSGESMKLAVQYLQYHGCKEVHTAAIASKPWSTFAVDYFGFETEAWILFPHENRESIQLLQKMWHKKGDSPEQIRQQLIQTGLPKDEVEFFTKIK